MAGVPQLSYMTLTLLMVGFYFLWMDVALYINLQQLEPREPDYNTDSESASNKSQVPFSPFYPLTVKLLFQGPTIHYIDNPLAYWTVKVTNISKVLSANAVSFIGVVFAACAVRCFLSDSLRVRQFGVLLFKIRDYIDSVDGYVARERMRVAGMVPKPYTFGYYVDGVADGLADLFLFVGLFFFFFRTGPSPTKHSNGLSYTRMESKPGDLLLPVTVSLKSLKTKSFWRKAFPYIVLVIMMAGQTILTTIMWNTNMVRFHKLLETDLYAHNPEQYLVQSECLKSSTFWIIVYFFRLFNPHSVNQYILISILYNKTYEYFQTMKLWGYLPTIIVSVLSFFYAKVVLSRLLNVVPLTMST